MREIVIENGEHFAPPFAQALSLVLAPLVVNALNARYVRNRAVGRHLSSRHWGDDA